MLQSILLLSPGRDRLTMLSLGLLRALDEKGLRVAFLKPLIASGDRSLHWVQGLWNGRLPTAEGVSLEVAEQHLTRGSHAELQEIWLRRAESLGDQADILVIEGCSDGDDGPAYLCQSINQSVAASLDAKAIVLANAENLAEEVEAFCLPYRHLEFLGLVVNQVAEASGANARDLVAGLRPAWRFLGAIPRDPLMARPRILDLQRHVSAEVLSGGDLGLKRRIACSHIASMGAGHALGRFREDSLVIAAGDRDDILIASAARSATRHGGRISGIILTGGFKPEPQSLALARALDQDFPVLAVEAETYETAAAVNAFRARMECDDREKAEAAQALVARSLDRKALAESLALHGPKRLSPAAFRYRILQEARRQKPRIVLPEGDEPRTLKAAERVLREGLADLILLGDVSTIREAARREGAKLDGATIIDPRSAPDLRTYAEDYAQIRAHKGIILATALDMMLDPIYYGTMMLRHGAADGLVSGAVHTTRHTIKPAFEIIKTAQGYSIVSSVFFMCLEDKVLVYGDCAVNPSPSAEELAEIALQSAETARAFGLEPALALLSYSTGESGQGGDVDKVRRAVAIARERAPSLLIDGPMQYDAAQSAEVAKTKAPHSPTAGRANVLIFPDLDAGNTTYKAVQRTSGAVAIGPVLQGLNLPVNDLSRGATVEDIFYTIAITAVQAGQARAAKCRADHSRI